MQVISKSKNYDGTIMSFMEGGVARNSCIVRLAYQLWRTMPGTHDAHSLLKPQQPIYMHRGEKHKNIADGRKGRVGQRLPCTNKEFKAALTQGQKTDNAQMKNNCFKQLGDCQTRINERTEALSQVQAKMARLMEKKPKEK